MTETLLLSGRVLDLTDEKGYLCGRILGDLGADVIKVEKPGGDPGRNIGPFYQDIPHPERSLFWFSYNSNKRSITLNIETTQGQGILKELARTADFLLESFPVGYMDSLGLGYSTFSKINPGIIVTSITPFGQTGPYTNYKGPDMVCMALGGLMYLTGDPDRPPIKMPCSQAYLLAGAEGAAGSMIAHHHRQITGEGQRVDVSIQESVAQTILHARCWWDFAGVIVQRAGRFREFHTASVRQNQTWECKNGHVCFLLFGGRTGLQSNQKLMQWIGEEGMLGDSPSLKDVDWETLDMATITQEYTDRVEDVIARFFLAHTKAELYEGALKRGIMIYPVSSVKDVAESPQLRARNYWTEVAHPEIGASLTYPGGFVKASEASCAIRRRAPLIGEHNGEIYEKELGLSKTQVLILKQAKII